MSKRLIPVCLLALGASLAACERPDTLNPSFGNSVRHNMSMHIIDPEPLPADTPAPALAGPRAIGVMKRYEEGEVTDLETVTTSGVGGGQ